MSDFWKDVFPSALAAARHQDLMAKWPWWARLLHKTFRRKCPACVYWREQMYKPAKLGGRL